ncbi:NAD(P)-binding Rossmann-fold superfamily protein [Striga asiatica]|uniref:NAD(P)-binding Rossmann-fold superfamily protein n=1 Tax=Striga asiatica TaxID=4170 RepID=A0A5A7PNA6_STRAF|nr:NAD(P)-binding Rossmann-fold superfamily protein [Striga asiatica]
MVPCLFPTVGKQPSGRASCTTDTDNSAPQTLHETTTSASELPSAHSSPQWTADADCSGCARMPQLPRASVWARCGNGPWPETTPCWPCSSGTPHKGTLHTLTLAAVHGKNPPNSCCMTMGMARPHTCLATVLPEYCGLSSCFGLWQWACFHLGKRNAYQIGAENGLDLHSRGFLHSPIPAALGRQLNHGRGRLRRRRRRVRGRRGGHSHRQGVLSRAALRPIVASVSAVRRNHLRAARRSGGRPAKAPPPLLLGRGRLRRRDGGRRTNINGMSRKGKEEEEEEEETPSIGQITKSYEEEEEETPSIVYTLY